MATNLLTTAAAAASLGITQRRVVALIKAGSLPAEKVGMQYLIRPADLEKVRNRKPGRPAAKPAKGKGGKAKGDGKGST